jgi:hypothetical protein
MSKFSEIVKNHKLQNSLSTGFIKGMADKVDQTLNLDPEENITTVYANKTMLYPAVIVVQTNMKVHIFLDKSVYVCEIEDVVISKGMLGQTNIIANIKNKEKELTLYKAFDIDERFDKNIGDIVKDKFQKLEYPFEEAGFRVQNHLNYLSQMLDEDEEVLYLFVGQAINWNVNTTACAVTSKNTFVFASKGLIGDDNLKRIRVSDIREISVNSTLIVSNVVVETLTEKFAVNLANKEKAIKVQNTLRNYISRFEKEAKSSQNLGVAALSPAEEIKKFKALMDEGTISEKEFEDKKKQLLGL